jgi:hypothetical protein
MEEEEYLERLRHYIEIGAIREAGIDQDGEIIFEIDEDHTKELAPELWEAHMEYIDNSFLELYKEGLVEVEYDEDLNAIMHLTKEGYDIAIQKGLIPIDIDNIPDN